MDPQVWLAYQVAVLDELTGGSLTATKIALFSNAIDLTPTTPLADLDIVLQTGMGTTAVTWAAAFVDSEGQAALVGGSHVFRATGSVASPFTVYGWVITNDDGDVPLFGMQLPEPVLIQHTDDGLVVTPIIRPFTPFV